MPLFLRKERGDLKIIDNKILSTDLQLKNQEVLILNQIENEYNQWKALSEQIIIFQNNVDLFQQILNAENRLYQQEESSVTLIILH